MQEFYAHTSSHYSPKVLKLLSPPTSFLTLSACTKTIRMACSDIRFNSIYGLALVISNLLLDAVLIIISYIMILHAVLAIASREERIKSLADLCISHLCCCFGFLHPNHWSDHGSSFWQTPLTLGSCSHGQCLYPFPTLDESHYLQYQDPTNTKKSPEIVLTKNVSLNIKCECI